jgi:uncharacterized protein (TIGR03067 family)
MSEKESITMPRVPTTRVVFLLAAALAWALWLGRPARAGVILAVGDPQNNGVMVFDGALEAFAPASDSPAHASAGNGRSSLNTLGSEMRLSFEVSGRAIASTGLGSPSIYFAPIPILIEGTSGEAAGSPVNLQLQAGGNVPSGPGYTNLFINNTLYSANQTYNFTNFNRRIMCRMTWTVCWLILWTGPLSSSARQAEEAQKQLQGTWTATKAVRDGKAAEDVVGHRLSFTRNHFQIRSKDGRPLYAGTFRVVPSTKPAAIDFEHTEGALKGKAWKGIYALDGDMLMTCDNAPDLDKGRPTAFEAKTGSGYVLIKFKRAKP